MSVSVILIAYRGDDWIPRCVESLKHASTGRLHLVLVDNGYNTVLSALDLSAFDAEVLTTASPLGFAEANNFALASSHRLRDYVLFLNQDTISTPGWIDRCIECFDSRDNLGAASPLIRTYDGQDWDPNFKACLPSDATNGNELTNGSGIFQVDEVPAPALFVRRDVLQAVGPFDPIFGSYYEDYDLCFRIRKAGWSIGICAGARIHHYSGSSTTTREADRKRQRQVIRNRIILDVRRAGRSRRATLFKQLVWILPRRLARSLIGSTGAQSPTAVLRAYGDLLRIGGRIASEAQDSRAWRRYLHELGWADLPITQEPIPAALAELA